MWLIIIAIHHVRQEEEAVKYMKKQQTAKAKDKGNMLRGVIATYVPCGFQRTETIDVDTINY